jgi:hypothetical protein
MLGPVPTLDGKGVYQVTIARSLYDYRTCHRNRYNGTA